MKKVCIALAAASALATPAAQAVDPHVAVNSAQYSIGISGFGNTVVESSSAGGNDKLVWLNNVEDPLKRSDMWNEVKATP